MQQSSVFRVALKDRPRPFQIITLLLFVTSVLTVIISTVLRIQQKEKVPHQMQQHSFNQASHSSAGFASWQHKQ